LVAAALGVILLGKPIAAFLIILALKYPLRIAIAVAVVLAQIGEFSFILARAGKSLGLLDDRAVNTIIAAALISITLNPILYRLIGPLQKLLGRLIKTPVPADLLRQSRQLEWAQGDEAWKQRAIVVGYGPVGRTLAHLLRENRVEPVVIDLNIDTVRQ